MSVELGHESASLLSSFHLQHFASRERRHVHKPPVHANEWPVVLLRPVRVLDRKQVWEDALRGGLADAYLLRALAAFEPRAVDLRVEAPRRFRIQQVDEGKAFVLRRAEVHWHVEEIEALCKAMILYVLKHHVRLRPIRNITQHQSGGLFINHITYRFVRNYRVIRGE